MAEWLVEEGIGEHRAIVIDGGTISKARLLLPGHLVAGQVEDAKLVLKRAGTRRGKALFASGEQTHVDNLPADASEGANVRLEVVRPRIWESGRRKLAQARPTDKALCSSDGLAGLLRQEGHTASVVHRFPAEVRWTELWQEAETRFVEFAKGSFSIFPTPAMLLIDVDGDDEPFALASAAIGPIARTLHRLDLGGNIGIDFPTVAEKAKRKAIDEKLSDALAGWPHERTAMNGFGFVQIVSRLERPSLLNTIGADPAAAKARALLREAEGVQEPGNLLLTCAGPVAQAMQPEWLEELARRTGRTVEMQTNSGKVAMERSFVQAVAP